jgi:hypothetical protein
MRIISDFHDYYDVGMQNGIDPQLPYRRFRREEKVDFHDPALSPPYSFCLKIGFAGKVWSCIDISMETAVPSYCYKPSSIDHSLFIEIAKNREEWKWDYWSQKLLGTRCSTPQEKAQFGIKVIQQEVAKFFEGNSNAYRHNHSDAFYLGLFEKYKTAIWVHKLGSGKIIINERLNQYRFQKALPPMQAFQELEMYAGACLTKPVIEEPPIPDKIKVEIHGFDKYSFRKDKSKKK